MSKMDKSLNYIIKNGSKGAMVPSNSESMRVVCATSAQAAYYLNEGETDKFLESLLTAEAVESQRGTGQSMFLYNIEEKAKPLIQNAYGFKINEGENLLCTYLRTRKFDPRIIDLYSETLPSKVLEELEEAKGKEVTYSSKLPKALDQIRYENEKAS